MNLHDKTPQQLNMMVAEIKYPDAVNIGASSYSDSAYVQFKDGDKDFMIEWINDDALAFRLMVANKICPAYSSGWDKWIAEHPSTHASSSWCKSLNRAIVETFILMNQSKEA